MATHGDVSGGWSGEYLQHGRSSPISAELEQEGEQLSGSMRDGAPDRETSLFQAAAEAGLPPGTDERLTARIREMYPELSDQPITAVSHLPPTSRLEGWVRGDRVYFLKTYEGTSSAGFKVGDRLMVSEQPAHSVHYQGRLSPDGREIDGRWWIDAKPELGHPRLEGLFTLRRPG
ncbi:MAG: hypothetical protein U0835_00735 [Isosphaeraceae bacterium]